jgi:hypothetical protein
MRGTGNIARVAGGATGKMVGVAAFCGSVVGGSGPVANAYERRYSLSSTMRSH